MICVSISDKNPDTCVNRLKDEELAEIRLDLTHFSEKEIDKVFSTNTKLIATLRPDKLSDAQRLKLLKKAIDAGAAYLDIEYEAGVKYRKELSSYAKERACELIISYHNYEVTPSRNELERIVNDCYLFGADVAKIATQVINKQDIANLLSLYSTTHRIVSIGMGEKGKLTRVLSLLMGAEFTYAAPDDGTETAPGQLKKTELKRIINQLDNI
jgi:3-dehydroquinate dehydratase-1